MDWQTDFVKQFLGSIAALVGVGLITYLGLIGKVLLPAIQAWAKSKGNTLVYTLTTLAVKAAEQRLDVITGEQKLKYVEDFLTSRGIAFDRTFVEAAVHDMNTAKAATVTVAAAPLRYETTGYAQVLGDDPAPCEWKASVPAHTTVTTTTPAGPSVSADTQA